MTVIDVHTHMLTLDWIELLKQHGGAYDVKPTKAGQNLRPWTRRRSTSRSSR
jgi:hypothetical protein